MNLIHGYLNDVLKESLGIRHFPFFKRYIDNASVYKSLSIP